MNGLNFTGHLPELLVIDCGKGDETADEMREENKASQHCLPVGCIVEEGCDRTCLNFVALELARLVFAFQFDSSGSLLLRNSG